ncbi:unnamed protein product [Symbiodinium natans]|uniref:Plastid lipid-associated protein/fibrillin conserved domain-containing protein n=1 Tax=Symbiodinium natans TaxID=878477 RepID=A0A812V0W2_9DINO|nr:unnamed protein product [Symbiodinium natans]
MLGPAGTSRRGWCRWVAALLLLTQCSWPSGFVGRTGLRATPASAGEADVSYKEELQSLCDEFRSKQEEMWEMMDEQEQSQKSSKSKGKSKASLLQAESFAAQRVELGEELDALRNGTIQAIERVAAQNPNSAPLKGWRGFGGVQPSECALNGTWKLIFTDAADATFKKSKRGSANTFQEIDAEAGWFINCVDFSNPESKLRGFRVFVEGRALNDFEVELIFRKVRLLRRSRFLPEITIPLPGPGFLRKIGRLFARRKGGEVNPSDRGAGFKLLYVDENLRIHQTFDGLYFVQKRLA